MTNYDHVHVLWDYLNLYHPLRKSDLIIGFGSYDTMTAERCAALFLEGWAPLLLFSGGLGKGTAGFFAKPEAEVYGDIAIACGIPSEKILLENRSTHSGENILFTKRILEDAGLDVRSILVVHKPYMGRRVYATIRKQWPQVFARIAPNNISFEEHREHFLKNGGTEDEIIQSMVGDLQRMDLFAKKGFQLPQEIPGNVLDAYASLVELGYTKYIV